MPRSRSDEHANQRTVVQDTNDSGPIGRDAELLRLAAAYRRGGSGEGTVVLVSGPAGVGKTMLVRWSATGWATPILWCAGTRDERSRAFGVADQILARSATAALHERDPLVVGNAIVAAVESVIDDHAVLVIDDAQWVDELSIKALGVAIRRFTTAPVLVVFVCRDVAPADPSAQDVERVVRLVESVGGERLVLRGLDYRGMRQLVRRHGMEASPSEAQQLVRATGGIPLYAEAVIRQLRPGDLSRLDSDAPVLRDIATWVDEAWLSTDLDGRRLLEAAAVLGDRTPLDIVARVAGLASEGLTRALQSATRSGVLTAGAGSSATVSFSHDVIRAAVARLLSPEHRRSIHRRAAQVVSDPATQYRHLVAAATGPDASLFADGVLRAENQASLGDPAAAATLLLDARRVAPDAGAIDQALLRAVQLCLLAGDTATATSLQAELEACTRSAARDLLLGRLEMLRGRADRARTLIAAVASDAGAPVEVRALGVASLAAVAQHDCMNDDVYQWTARAAELTEDPLIRAYVGALRAGAMAIEGRVDEALAQVDNDADLGNDVIGAMTRGVVMRWAGDYSGAIASLEVASRQRATFELGIAVLGCLSDSEYWAARWDDALEHAGAVLALADDGATLFSGPAHSLIAQVCAERGSWADAERHSRLAAQLAERMQTFSIRLLACHAGAVLERARDRPAACLAALAPLDAYAGRSGFDNDLVNSSLPLRIEAHLSLGDFPAARKGLDVLQARWRLHPDDAEVLTLRLLLAARSGGPDGGESLTCAARTAPCRSPFARGRLHLALAEFAVANGDTAEARVALAVANQTFYILGATPWNERCERLRDSIDATRRVISPLSPQERAAARRAAEGKRNKEIAAELFLSVKTVETHLAAAYRKLGVRSRTELARIFPDGPA